MSCCSTRPQAVAGRNVVRGRPYGRSYDANQLVVCLDEKPVTLHADVRPASPAAPGREARRDNKYERCGTANVFCAVEPKAGRHFTFPTPDRSGFEFAQVLFHLALKYPKAETIHLVMDNVNSHPRKSLSVRYGAEMANELWNCFTAHYTPTHGSWLNQAEIEIGIFARQCLGSRRNPRPQDPPTGGACLESADESRSRQDQLEVRSQGRPQVPLQKEILHAVKDLARWLGPRGIPKSPSTRRARCP